jgi:hypothetical protein
VGLAAEAPAHEYEIDNIKVEYHPHSGRADRVHHFGNYKREWAAEPSTPRNRKPWEPFHSRLDFEFAELALQAALSKEETGRLINLVQRAITGKEQFTLATHKEVQETWSSLEHRFTPVS